MQRNRSAHTACILPNRPDIVNSRKLFSNKKNITQIFLFLFRSSKCNAFFWWITYLQKKRKNRERISVTHCFLFSLKGLSLTIFNSAYPRLLVQGDANYPSMKEFYHIQSLALFTAAVFNCRKPMSSFPRSCYLRRI